MSERRGDRDTGEPEKLGIAIVRRMATDYLTRYAASSMRLRRVLERRIRRWSAQRDQPAPEGAVLSLLLDETLNDLVRLGLLDDGAFAVARARGLVRKGLPRRRIRSMLEGEGLDAKSDDLETVIEPDEGQQAARFTARKRLGPHRSGDRAAFRDKDIRALLRAGFSFRAAATAVDADLPAAEPDDAQ